MKRSLIAGFLLAFLLTACSFSLAEDITPPPGSEQLPQALSQQPEPISGPLYPLVPPNPEAGKPIYTEKCAPCHGETGRGDGPNAGQLPNPVAAIGSDELARQATPADWYTQVTSGNLEKFMPPFNSLSDRQRWDVVAYAFSLSVSVDTLEQGAELYKANCARCHGDQGSGDGPDAGELPQAIFDFTDQESMAKKSAQELFDAITSGAEPHMISFDTDLDEVSRWALTAYVRSLSFNMQEESQAIVSQGEETLPPETSSTQPQGLEATPLAAVSPEAGSVSGLVVNASGGDVPAGIEVTLHGFDDMQEVYSQTIRLDDQDTYSFQNVAMPEGRVFLVTVEYDQATYGSDIGIVQSDTSELDLPVEIYETTTDSSVLRADRAHFFFEFLDESTMRVVELYIISNNSNQTLVPGDGGEPSIKFKLPEGASNLEFQDGVLGERYIQTSDGFGDTRSVRPGEGVYELLFAFEMPYDRKMELAQPLSLPVDAVVILIPEGGLKVKGEMLVDDGMRDVQGVEYHLYNGGSMQAGDVLNLTISGKPGSSSPSLTTGSSTGVAIGLGVFGIALVTVGVLLYRRTRGMADEQSMVEEQGEFEESADSLVEAIIALDDLYKAGELPEDAYQQRRAALKERLKALLD